MTVQNLGMLGGRRQLMKPSERLDALRPSLEREAAEAEAMRPGTMLDQLVRAEAAVREDPGHAMFSEGETYQDFHFGTDIPTGEVLFYDGGTELVESRVVEIVHDPMPIDGWDDGETSRRDWLFYVVSWSLVVLMLGAAVFVAFTL